MSVAIFSIVTASMTVQQSLTRLLNNYLHRLLKSIWHNCSTVTGTIVQQSLAQLSNSHRYEYSRVKIVFLFFSDSVILQQGYSLLKNRAMYQESQKTHDIVSTSGDQNDVVCLLGIRHMIHVNIILKETARH